MLTESERYVLIQVAEHWITHYTSDAHDLPHSLRNEAKAFWNRLLAKLKEDVNNEMSTM